MAVKHTTVRLVGKPLRATRESVEALALDFARVGSGGGGSGEHDWIAPLYNPGSPELARIRGLIALPTHTGTDCEVAILADSKSEGRGADAGKRPLQSWVGVVRRMLSGVEGFITALQPGQDDRWTITNLTRPGSDQNGLVPDVTADPVAAGLTYDEPHDGGTFWIHSATGGSVTVTVDGGTPEDFTLPGADGFQPVTPTITGDTAHSYLVESTGGIDILAGFRPTYAGPRLKFSNLGRTGAQAAHWVPGYNSTQTGLWDAFLATTSPDIIMSQLGTNQPQTSAGPLATLWDAIVGVTPHAIIIAPGGLGGVDGAFPISEYRDMYGALYTAADTHNLPLIDFQAIIGDHETADALGWLDDQVHESKDGYAVEGANVAGVIA